MAITRVGSATASATTITLPAGRIVGDLEIMIAFNKSSAVPATVPSDWTVIQSNYGFGCSAVAAYRYCFATNDTSGTWTNATQLVAVVYRNAISVGASGLAVQSSNQVAPFSNSPTVYWACFNATGPNINLADPYGGTAGMSITDDGTTNIHGMYYFNLVSKTASTQVDWDLVVVAKQGDGQGFATYVETSGAVDRGGTNIDLSGGSPSIADHFYGNLSVLSSSFYSLGSGWYQLESKVRCSSADTNTSVSFVIAGSGGGTNNITYAGTSGQPNFTAAAASVNVASATLTYPGLTLLGTNSRSWVVAVGCSTAATNVNTQIPAGLTNVTSITATGAMVALADTNGGVSSFTQSAQTVNTSGGQIGITFEIADHTTFDPYRSALFSQSAPALLSFGTDQLSCKVATTPTQNGTRFMSRILSSGKRVYKITMASNAGSTTDGVGLANTNCTSTTVLGNTTDSLMLNTSGQVIINNINQGSTGVTWTSSDTLYIAVDIDNDKFWVKNGSGNWNNSPSNSPDTGVGGVSISALTNANGFCPAVRINNAQATESTGFVYDGTGGAHGLTTFIGWDGVTMLGPTIGATNAETVNKSTTRVNIYPVSMSQALGRRAAYSLAGFKTVLSQYITLKRPKTVKTTGHGQSIFILKPVSASRGATQGQTINRAAQLVFKAISVAQSALVGFASRSLGRQIMTSQSQQSLDVENLGVFKGMTSGQTVAPPDMGYTKNISLGEANTAAFSRLIFRWVAPNVTSLQVVTAIKKGLPQAYAVIANSSYNLLKSAILRRSTTNPQSFALAKSLVVKRATTQGQSVNLVKQVGHIFGIAQGYVAASFRTTAHVVRVLSVSLQNTALTIVASHFRNFVLTASQSIGALKAVTTQPKSVTQTSAARALRSVVKPFAVLSPATVAARAQASFFRVFSTVIGSGVSSARAVARFSNLSQANSAASARSVNHVASVAQASSVRALRSIAHILGIAMGYATGLASRRSVYTGHVNASVTQSQSVLSIRTRGFRFGATSAQQVGAWYAGIFPRLEVLAYIIGRSTAAVINGVAG